MKRWRYQALGWAAMLLAIGLDAPDYFRGFLSGFGLALLLVMVTLPRNHPETTRTGVNETKISG
jgi:Na+(H+)/acetate symporter ActP